MKILTVVGARPQFIKAAVVSRELKSFVGDINEVIVHTGQHYDANMSEVFFKDLDIPIPNYNLAIGGGTHGQNTGRMLEAIEGVISKEHPQIVLIYGDTDSTLAGALAAAKLHVPVVHVEAGLRSFNRAMPEEVNRVLTDHISEILFAPTIIAKINLEREGISSAKISVVGDVMLDASNFYADRAVKPVWFESLNNKFSEFVLCTIHRAENTDKEQYLRQILDGLHRCGHHVILPLHPRTRSKIQTYGIKLPNTILVTEPVGYLEMVWLEANCMAIATDSGGVQKEAYFHRKPCVTLRSETEWTELVDVGANVLAGADPVLIASALRAAQFDVKEHDVLYGDGRAGKKIVSLIAKAFK
ncbi:UDP-N-acetylglucosamine 2-epimerase (non-hydrolyzing) [Variovorax sp. J22G73]|uniref:non-hydrolyzing UDP-N-acetylglucosamine 2-epimerase n=1 Tax=unclassified Variovorax TaxID=663243 RepID=UPI0025778D93|nr:MULTISPECIES: UDP-N-acetylglucosamine 2-epimerase (non-hydrolyzing) [unclassified Variovorax]MDM0004457.1 UDP-N-acetylglucosamine 2-epimerase (non-hydrolyzing) [Variovorax sp. J22R203]MDM0095877.1 UDP-N-acetylglucosamine 2-epimerase (non-hydrolyzing) [Variovorax sp. J22G73]